MWCTSSPEARRVPRSARLWVGVVFLLIGTGLGSAQEDPIVIKLGTAYAVPGANAIVSLSASGIESRHTVKLVVRITSDTVQPTLMRVERPPLVDDNVQLESEVSPSTSEGQSAVIVRIASKDASKQLPDGTLANLVFRVDPAVTVDQMVELTLAGKVDAIEPPVDAGRPPLVEPGKILLASASLEILNCFFYMH